MLLNNRQNANVPKMVVRPHVPWYRRLLIILTGILLVTLLAYGAFEMGKSTVSTAPPIDNTISEPVLEQIFESESGNCLEKYDADLCSKLAELVKQLQISNATRLDLAKQVKSLDEENDRLREDLTVFQEMISGNGESADAELVIHRFSLEPGQLQGEYLYTLLLTQNGQDAKGFSGKLEFVVTLIQEGEKKLISLVDENASKGFPVSFRFYHRLEKSFQVPADTAVESLEVRIFENNSNKAILTQLIQLSS